MSGKKQVTDLIEYVKRRILDLRLDPIYLNRKVRDPFIQNILRNIDDALDDLGELVDEIFKKRG